MASTQAVPQRPVGSCQPSAAHHSARPSACRSDYVARVSAVLSLYGPNTAHPDGRFAPSPTGVLHLGNLRTALLAWLFARAQSGRFLVRLEDLDSGRVRTAFYDEQLRDLVALGLDWDGPVVRQSERTALYERALRTLDTAGLVYPCWCTRAEIRNAASAPHGTPGEDRYPGTCRNLSEAERAARTATGRPAAVRARVETASVALHDRCAGATVAPLDDFVLQRSDRAFAYNLAVVVDDHDQGVGEVVRGADLLETTGRQVWLHGQLGLTPPSYIHVPMLLGSDGARLAKRHGAVTLADRAALGEPPAAVRTALAASVGLCERSDAPTLDELIARSAELLTSANPATP